jgi:ABC-type uncharacterized transport system substrate-binding protein
MPLCQPPAASIAPVIDRARRHHRPTNDECPPDLALQPATALVRRVRPKPQIRIPVPFHGDVRMLKQVAPRVTRVAVLRDSLTPVGIGQLAAIQGVASSFGVELSPLVVRDVGEIEPAVAAFARTSNDGLIVTIGTLTDAHREVISALAARHRLPAVYPFPFFVRSGGLISYGPDIIDSYRRAAGYVDRILKGEKPADLPVQQPTKIDLAINLKAAKALGLEIPPMLLNRADEVIE